MQLNRFLIFSTVLMFGLLSCTNTVSEQVNSNEDAAITNETQDNIGADAVTAPDLVQADVERDLSPPAAAADLAALAAGNTAFAAEFYRELTAVSQNNLIFSPFSISLAFSMVYGGSAGETEVQMRDAFLYLPQESHHTAFNALEQQLTGLGGGNGSQNGDPLQLTIANSVWGQEGLPFEEAYLTLLAAQYGSGVHSVDFATQSAEVAEMVNQWVAEQTNDKIDQLVAPDGLSPQTRLLLANAIYFNGSWETAFSPNATTEAPFTLLAGETVTVPMMSDDALRTSYMETDTYQAIQLPYVGNEAYMLIILPCADCFAQVEAMLSEPLLADTVAQMETFDVTFQMPRFAIESNLNLIEQLKQMGLAAPFDGATADFSGIVADSDFAIGQAVHQATIEVDEEGTEAAAATAVMLTESGMEPAEMLVNRPFIFTIMDRETASVLFMGRVLDPSQQ